MRKVILILTIVGVISGCNSTVEVIKESDVEIEKQAEVNLKDETERELAVGVDLIKSGKLEEAINHLKKSSHYEEIMDYKMLSYYSNALLHRKDKNYKYEVFYLKGIPQDYNGVMHEEIQQQKDNLNQVFADMIKRKEYEAIKEILFDSREDSQFSPMYNYSVFLKNEKDYLSNARYYLSNIPETYDGVLAEEIKKAQRKYGTGIIVRDREQQSKIIDKPQIGMTAEEVLKTRWGTPEDINTTTTVYGTNEQWVYSSDRYVYIENGVVTTIQE
ncbi:hypothetical protein [Brevibacillus fortis]|uniref:hypothetical protein n=1 Tax=Brevibacillus fortis TaxID=2126352 RepID=UPI0038FC8747